MLRPRIKRDSENTILKFLYRSVNIVFPYNRSGDKIFSFILFIFKHRRFPTKRMLFNDVLYRIKTSDEILDPLRVFVSDKEFLKFYVGAIAGNEYNVRTYAILRNIEEIDNYQFPANCCIKPTHLSGKVILRINNSPIDKNNIKSWFTLNRYFIGREANYKTLKPKVIVEELIFGNTNVEDYKFFCYNGVPKLIQVDIDRNIDHTRKFFDVNWNELDFSIIYPRNMKRLEKPENFTKMINIAKMLSEPFSFIRIDLYSNGKIILVGEITNCSENAGGNFIPKSAEVFVSKKMFIAT